MAAPLLVEYWLRGPIENVPALLQPAAHALLQARDEIKRALVDFPENKLWIQPVGVASIAFHLQHLAGVISRLLTYARGEALSQEQLDYLKQEGKQQDGINLQSLLQYFDEHIEFASDQIKATDPAQLTETRMVGRKQIPATVIGLIFHTAEHTMRHTGQLLVTVAILKDSASAVEI